MACRTYLETPVAEELAHRAELRLTRAVCKAQFPSLCTIDDLKLHLPDCAAAPDAPQRAAARSSAGP